MDVFAEMKGSGRRLFSVMGANGQIDLVRYPDQSLGILRNNTLIGIWEADSETECLSTLARIAPCDPITAILLVRADDHHSNDAPLN